MCIIFVYLLMFYREGDFMYSVVSNYKNVSNDGIRFNYYFDNIDYYYFVVNFINSLKESGIQIKNIMVRNISDYDEGLDINGFSNLEEYLSSYNKDFFPNSIDYINILCYQNDVRFIANIDAGRKNVEVHFYSRDEKLSFDNVISNTVAKSR